MKGHRFGYLVLSYLVAVLFAVVWGAVVQTQYNLQGLASLGVDVSGGVRWSTIARDVFGGFTPTYGGYVIAPALLVAFLAAGWISRRSAPLARALWFALAGLLAVWLAIPLVNWLAPVALLVGASRDPACTFWMAVGGGVAGLLFAWMTRHRQRREVQPVQVPLEPSSANPPA